MYERKKKHLFTTYNNYHCQAYLLADLPKIPLMYILVLWNNFLKKKKEGISNDICKGRDSNCSSVIS